MLGSMLFAVKQAFSQVFRNRAMSTASIFSITSMLLILGLFFILMVNINMVTESVKSQFDVVQIYLMDENSPETEEILISDINRIKEVDSVSYLTKEEALENFKLDFGEYAASLDGLNKNPLPNSLIIKLKDVSYTDTVVSQIKNHDGIIKIMYYKEAIASILKITKYIQLAALVIIVFLVIVSVVVVSNTVKLTVLAREREINIMKYVGATNWFIRGPFLVEGMLIGFISAVISLGVISLIYYKLVEFAGAGMVTMMSVSPVPVDFLVTNLVWIFIALGVSIGACGSIISMRRFLDT